ncbi:MAG: sigma-70 family RNA polymerase sigma factor [Actinomycetota bacterium]
MAQSRTTQSTHPADPGRGAPPDFDTIYRRYRSDLVRYALRRGADDAEGVADLALLDLARAFDRLRSTDEPVLRAYLYKAARNRTARERAAPTEDIADHNDIEDFLATSFDDEVAAGIDMNALLTQLSSPQEEALRLRFFSQMTSSEAADIMQVEASTVRTHQRRGLTRLRQLIIATIALAVVVAGIVVAFGGGDADLILNGPVAPAPVPSTTTPFEPDPFGPNSVQDAAGGIAAAPAEVDAGTEDAPTAPPSDPEDEAPAAETTAPTTTTPGAASSTTTTEVIPVLPGPPPTTSTTLADQTTFLAIFDDASVQFSSFLVGNDCTSVSGANLVLERSSCRFDVNPLWRVSPADEGYVVTDTQGSSCWTVDASDSVITSPCNGALNQRWYIEHTNGYRIRSAETGWCLEVEDAGAGPNLAVSTCLEPDPRHQRWGVYGLPDDAA